MSYREKFLTYFSQRDRAGVLALFAMVCLLYLPFIGNPFIFDDLNFFQGQPKDYYANAWFHFDLRWLPYASLGWTYTFFSDIYTHFYHLGNLLLHAAAVITLFYLIRQLIEAVIPDSKNSPQLVWGAWIGALIFAVHPMVVYAVGYIIQRSILMATLFVLLMQLAYLRGLLTGQKRWLVLSVAAYFFAVFCKEHSVLAPALLAMETVLLRGRIRSTARQLWLTWVALGLVGAQIVLIAKGVIGIPYEENAAALFGQRELVVSTPMLHLLSVLTQAGLFFKYLLLMIIPNPAWMSVDMRESFLSSVYVWHGWLGALGFVMYGVLGFWLLLRPRWFGLLGFALLYPWVLYFLEFASIRVQEIFVLYRSYIWLPGLMFVIPILLSKWPGKKLLLALFIVVLLLLPMAWDRLWVLGDNYRLWNDAAKLLHSGQEPLASRIYYNRANASANLSHWEAAIVDYERSIALWPEDNAILHHDLGVAYYNTKRYQDALVQFDKTIRLDPKYARAYFDKGLTLKILNQGTLAMQSMEKSCELKYGMACMIVQMRQSKK